MAVGQEDLVQAAKTKAAAKQLALGAFATVHEETVFPVQDHGGRQAASDRGCRSRRAEKDEFEHERIVAQRGYIFKFAKGFAPMQRFSYNSS